MKRQILALACVLCLAGWLASVAAAGGGQEGDEGQGQGQCPSSGMVSDASAITIAGGRANVTFTIATKCKDILLSLVSNKAPSLVEDEQSWSQQQLFDSVTKTFSEGTYTLSVAVPNCYFQVDFVYGTPIVHLGPAGSNNFYGKQGRLIRALSGGVAACSGASTSTTVGTPAAAVTLPSISLVKLERIGPTGEFVAGPLQAKVGDTLYFQIVLANTGTTAVSANLNDPGCDAGTLAPSGPQGLEPARSVVFTCTHRLLATDGAAFVNTAIATANNAGPVLANATATVVAQLTPARGTAQSVPKTVKKKVKHAKKVIKRAKPAKPVKRKAGFTG